MSGLTPWPKGTVWISDHGTSLTGFPRQDLSFPDAVASDVGGVKPGEGSFEGESSVVGLVGDAISVELTLMSSLVALVAVVSGEDCEEECGRP